MAKAEPFSIRLRTDLEKKMWGVMQGTSGAMGKTDVIEKALELYFAALAVSPSILEFYDPKRDPSVTHTEDM